MTQVLEIYLGSAPLFHSLSSLITGRAFRGQLRAGNNPAIRDNPAEQRLPERWRRQTDIDQLPLSGFNSTSTFASTLVYQASVPNLSPSVRILNAQYVGIKVEFDPGSMRPTQGKIQLPRECFIRRVVGEDVNVLVNGQRERVSIQKTDLDRRLSSQKLFHLIERFNIGEPLGSSIESIGRVSVNVPASYPLKDFMQKVIYPIAECVPVYQMLEKAGGESGLMADTYDFVIVPQPLEDQGGRYTDGIPDPARKTPLIVLSHGGFDSWQTNFGFDVRTTMEVDTIQSLLGDKARVSPYNGGNSINVYCDAGRHGVRIDFSAARDDIAWFSGEIARKLGNGLVVSPNFISAPPQWFIPIKDTITLDEFGGGLAPSSLEPIFSRNLRASTLG